MQLFRRAMAGTILAAGTTLVALPGATYAANPPQISYVQVLTSAGHPRTSFTVGQRVEFKVVVYAPGYKATALSTNWRVARGHTTLMTHMMHGFHGPTRGNLFQQTGSVHLSSHAAKGTYTVQAQVSFGSKRLSRTVRFYVR
jgi:hypothetical protein